MKRYGLIGARLGHSFSQRWFEAMFAREGVGDSVYGLYELDSLAGFRHWVESVGLAGFNVTLPYKVAVMEFLDVLTPEAEAVGAVNCVAVRNGRLIGHNTDAPAFRASLLPLLKPWHRQSPALVLGTGGAAKAVAAALRSLDIEPALVSRSPAAGQITYAEAARRAASAFLIVNATPAGMTPRADSTPWPYLDNLSPKHLCFDLVYNPPTTRFLSEAAARGAATANGLEMLHRQAQLSWDYWTAAPSPADS